MVKARAYSYPVPGMTFIHNAAAYRVVRWDSETSQWECRACGFAGVEPSYYGDDVVRECTVTRGRE